MHGPGLSNKHLLISALALGLLACPASEKKTVNAACSANAECESQSCHAGVCASVTPAGNGTTCGGKGECRSFSCSNGKCGPGAIPNGASCLYDEECAGQQCSGGQCQNQDPARDAGGDGSGDGMPVDAGSMDFDATVPDASAEDSGCALPQAVDAGADLPCGVFGAPCCGTSCGENLSCNNGSCGCGGQGEACCEGGCCAGSNVCAGESCNCYLAIDGFWQDLHLIRSDGTAWWIDAEGNQHQQIMILSAPLDKVSQVATGDGFGCAKRMDGSVWCWAMLPLNRPEISMPYAGQIGDGSMTAPTSMYQATQVKIGAGQNLDTVETVRASTQTVCAIKKDRTAWCWGSASKGQFGSGAPANHGYAIALGDGKGAAFSDIDDLAIGLEHICILRSDQTVWCVGENQYGQLGLGDTADRPAPTQVSLPQKVRAIAASDETTYVVTADGGAWSWGSILYYMAGNGSQSGLDLYQPTKVLAASGQPGSQLMNIAAIDGGYRRTCAFTEQNAPICWGHDLLIPTPWVDPISQQVVGSVWQMSMHDHDSQFGPAYLTRDGILFNGRGNQVINLSCP
jgi:hypothetical protein